MIIDVPPPIVAHRSVVLLVSSSGSSYHGKREQDSDGHGFESVGIGLILIYFFLHGDRIAV
jgi:hypothetical protein